MNIHFITYSDKKWHKFQVVKPKYQHNKKTPDIKLHIGVMHFPFIKINYYTKISNYSSHTVKLSPFKMYLSPLQVNTNVSHAHTFTVNK